MMSEMIQERRQLWFEHLLLSPSITQATSALAYLFPTKEHVRHPAALPGTNDTALSNDAINWIESDLNNEQRKAIREIATNQHDVPYLLFGPAGTGEFEVGEKLRSLPSPMNSKPGKTKTLVEAVLQIVRRQPNASVLVCAPSNSAADTIALRLAKRLRGEDMLRLQNPTRTIAEVPDVLKNTYCNLQIGQFELPDWQAVMRYRVVVTTCTDAGLLTTARLTNADLLYAQGEMGQLNPRFKPHLVPHWTHLIMDEVSYQVKLKLDLSI